MFSASGFNCFITEIITLEAEELKTIPQSFPYNRKAEEEEEKGASHVACRDK